MPARDDDSERLPSFPVTEPPRAAPGVGPARAFSVGLAAAAVLLLPLLGREFEEVFLIHPRVVAYCALFYLVLERARTGALYGSSRAVWLHVPVVAILVACFATFPWFAPAWVPGEVTSDGLYPGFKFTRLLMVAVPTAVAAVAARQFAGRPGFADGFRRATTVIAGLAVLQLVSVRQAIASTDYADFKDEAAFSTISLSLIFVFLQIVWIDRYVRSRTQIWQPIAASIVAFLSSFLLSQRTAMVLLVLFGLVLGARVVRGRMSVLLIVLGGLVAASMMLDTFVEQLDIAALAAKYPAQITRLESFFSGNDDSSAARLRMWEFGWTEGWRQPEGHGFGAFANYHFMHHYPHNVLIETLFELGVPVAALVATLLGFTIVIIGRQLRQGEGLLIGLGLVATLAYILKAGDLSSTGNWLFALYLAVGWDEDRASRTSELGP